MRYKFDTLAFQFPLSSPETDVIALSFFLGIFLTLSVAVRGTLFGLIFFEAHFYLFLRVLPDP